MDMNYFEHVAEQYPPDLRERKYEYWARLKRANEDYRQNNKHNSFQEEKEQFERWMAEQWGLNIQIEADGYSPYYTVKDEKKYLLFVLKYAK